MRKKHRAKYIHIVRMCRMNEFWVLRISALDVSNNYNRSQKSTTMLYAYIYKRTLIFFFSLYAKTFSYNLHFIQFFAIFDIIFSQIIIFSFYVVLLLFCFFDSTYCNLNFVNWYENGSDNAHVLEKACTYTHIYCI